MKKKLIIGLGTGRCGSTSLSVLLNSQKNTKVTHEVKPLLSWNFNEKGINQKLNQILDYNSKYVGDVAMYYLPYVEYILSKIPNAKFICMKRAKNKTIKSFMKKTEGRNRWMKHDGKKWEKQKWDKCFPNYDVKTKIEGISLYWEEYYSRANKLMVKFPNNFKVFKMDEAINSTKGVKSIISFVGINESSQIIKTETKYNVILDLG